MTSGAWRSNIQQLCKYSTSSGLSDWAMIVEIIPAPGCGPPPNHPRNERSGLLTGQRKITFRPLHHTPFRVSTCMPGTP
jgi:hypothetical protein